MAPERGTYDIIVDAEQFLRDIQHASRCAAPSTACECDGCIARYHADSLSLVRHRINATTDGRQ